MSLDLPECLRDKREKINSANLDVPFRTTPSPELGEMLPQFDNPAGAPDTTFIISGFAEVAQYQIFSLWCWNAVGATLAGYYGGQGASGTSQCANAASIFQIVDCCNFQLPGGQMIGELEPYFSTTTEGIRYDAPASVGNRPQLPDRVVHAAGLSPKWEGYGPDGPTDNDLHRVISSILNRKPVVMYLKFPELVHVLTIYGTSVANDVRWFDVADPWDGLATVDHIHEGGAWTHSMFVTDNAPPAPATVLA